MSLGKTLYNTVFKRQSTTFVFIMAGAFVFERVFNPMTDGYYAGRNKGVRRCHEPSVSCFVFFRLMHLLMPFITLFFCSSLIYGFMSLVAHSWCRSSTQTSHALSSKINRAFSNHKIPNQHQYHYLASSSILRMMQFICWALYFLSNLLCILIFSSLMLLFHLWTIRSKFCGLLFGHQLALVHVKHQRFQPFSRSISRFLESCSVQRVKQSLPASIVSQFRHRVYGRPCLQMKSLWRFLQSFTIDSVNNRINRFCWPSPHSCTEESKHISRYGCPRVIGAPHEARTTEQHLGHVTSQFTCIYNLVVSIMVSSALHLKIHQWEILSQVCSGLSISRFGAVIQNRDTLDVSHNVAALSQRVWRKHVTRVSLRAELESATCALWHHLSLH